MSLTPSPLMADDEANTPKDCIEQSDESITIPQLGEIRTPGQLLGGNNNNNNNDPSRMTTWPDLVGLTPEESEARIKQDMPGAKVQVVPPNTFVTMDMNYGRVRIYLDPSGKVVRPPRIG